MYVADESDARLASLTLSGVDIGEFDSGRTEYEGVAVDGDREAVVPDARVAVSPGWSPGLR